MSFDSWMIEMGMSIKHSSEISLTYANFSATKALIKNAEE